MKAFNRLTLGSILLALVLIGFVPEGGPEHLARYQIDGPFCTGCVGQLESAALEIDGVTSIKVDVVERFTVEIVFDQEKTTAEQIRDRVHETTQFRLLLKNVEEAGESAASTGLRFCPGC